MHLPTKSYSGTMRDISSTWIEYIHNVLWIQPTNPFKKPQAVSTSTQWNEKLSEGVFISYESMLLFKYQLIILGALELQTQWTRADGLRCAMPNMLGLWLLAHHVWKETFWGHCNLFGRTTKIAPSKMILTNYLVPKKEGWWWSQPPCSLSTSVG